MRLPCARKPMGGREHRRTGRPKASGVRIMSILVTPQTKILVQGITGTFGARHTQLSLAYGTQVVAGVTPGKGGQLFESQVPIFDTVAEAARQIGATVSAIIVPPPFAVDAILEAVY